MRYARLAMLLTLALLLVSCGGGGAASSGGGSPVSGPGGTSTVAGKTGVALDISVKRTASKDVRLATNEDVQEVLIDFLDPTTLRQVVNTTIVRRTAPTVDVTIDVPVGTWIMRCQGRTLSGEVAGTRYETTVTVVEGQTTQATAELNPAVILAAIQVAPGPTVLAAQGTTTQFTATGILSDLTTTTVGVAWSSSNPTVATINPNGLATALAAGTTVIQAQSGPVTGSATLTVTPTGVKSLQVTPNPVELSPGLTQQLTATAVFEDNTNQNVTGQVTWTSSSAGVASVNAAGVVTGGTPGNATVTATLGNATATTSVRVKPQLRSITLSPANVSLPVGLTQTVRATGVFSDNTTEDITESVTWTSANPATATVTNTGLVTAVQAGTTSVTATSGNLSAVAPVTVLPLRLTGLSVAPSSASLPKGAVQAFNATGTFNNNTTRDVTEEVTWTTTNTSVLAISNANGTRGQATAVNAGSSVVEATLDGISGSATVNVTPATLVSIALTPVQPEVNSGDLVVFRATGSYSDGTSLVITDEVTWTSGNVNVAVISNADGSRGNATSIAPGQTTITATLGNVTASTTFTTKAPTPPPPVPSPSPVVTVSPVLVSTINGDPTVSSGSANFGFRSQAVSADGRYVAFIAPGTVDGLGDRGVFRRDTTTGAVVRCSLTTAGALPTVPIGKQYSDVSISDDGSRVCFSTNQQLAPNDLGNSNTIQDLDVYLRDLSGAGTTTLVSLDNAGANARGYSTSPALSGNGSVVAFEWGPGAFASDFSNVLVANPIGNAPFPLTATDTLPNGQRLLAPQLSFDGSVVALGSNQDLANENFTAPTLTGQFMVFRWTGGVFTRISRQPGDVGPNPPAPPRSANYPDVSSDGNTISFEADYDLLVTRGSPEAHTNGQIYCWTNPSTITRISTVPATAGVTEQCSQSSISGDGRYIAYLSLGYQVNDTPAPNYGLFYREGWVRDRTSGRVGRQTYTGSPGGGQVDQIAISANGAAVAFTTQATAGLRLPLFTPLIGQSTSVVLMGNVVFNGATPPDKPTTPIGPPP